MVIDEESFDDLMDNLDEWMAGLFCGQTKNQENGSEILQEHEESKTTGNRIENNSYESESLSDQ